MTQRRCYAAARSSANELLGGARGMVDDVSSKSRRWRIWAGLRKDYRPAEEQRVTSTRQTRPAGPRLLPPRSTPRSASLTQPGPATGASSDRCVEKHEPDLNSRVLMASFGLGDRLLSHLAASRPVGSGKEPDWNGGLDSAP
jgi:hypothetical protein